MSLENMLYREMELKTLLNAGYIDTHAYNILIDAKISTLEDIYKYYLKFGSFIKLRKCGKKTNGILIRLAEESAKLFLPVSIIRKDSPRESPAIQDKNTASFIPQSQSLLRLSDFPKFHLLSVRSKNLINSNDLDLLDNFIGYYKKYRNFFRLRNGGKKSNIELTEFAVDLINGNCGNKEFESPDDELVMKIIRKVSDTFHVKIEDLEFLLSQHSESKIELFKLLSLCASKYLNADKLVIFNSVCNTNSQSTFLEIGQEINLTRERVRQISNQLKTVFIPKFVFLINNYIDPSKIFQYIDSGNDVVFIDDFFIEKISNRENTCFNVEIVSSVISGAYASSHSLVSFEYNKCDFDYLIKKEIVDGFNFTDFFSALIDVIEDNKRKSFTLEFYPFIFQFFKCTDLSLFNRVKVVCERILNSCVNIYLDENDNIVFTASRAQSLAELVLDVFKHNPDTPMMLDKVFDLVTELSPGAIEDEEELRSIILKIKWIKYLGRKSTYIYLDKYSIYDDVIGGSIGDMTVKYLRKKTSPVHIYELVRFINKFVPTNQKNLITNLRLTKSNELEFFKNSFIGLKNKDYSNENLDFQPISNKLYESILPKIGIYKYDSLTVQHKSKVDNLLKIGLYFINDFGHVVMDIGFQELVKRLAHKYEITEIQVLSILEPKIQSKELFLDKQNRLNLTTNDN